MFKLFTISRKISCLLLLLYWAKNSVWTLLYFSYFSYSQFNEMPENEHFVFFSTYLRSIADMAVHKQFI